MKKLWACLETDYMMMMMMMMMVVVMMMMITIRNIKLNKIQRDAQLFKIIKSLLPSITL
jgi:hypothetical protein